MVGRIKEKKKEIKRKGKANHQRPVDSSEKGVTWSSGFFLQVDKYLSFKYSREMGKAVTDISKQQKEGDLTNLSCSKWIDYISS